MSTEPTPTKTSAVSLPDEVLAFVKVLLTPFFSIIAGYAATLVARYFPGSDIKKSQLVWVFIAVSVAAAVAVIRWLERQPLFRKLETDLQPLLGEVVSTGLPAGVVEVIEKEGPALLEALTKLLLSKAGDEPPAAAVVSTSDALNGNA